MPPKAHTIGELRQRLTVQTATTTTDTIGGQTPTWQESATVYGMVDVLGGREQAIAGQLQAVANYRVVMRYRSDVGPKDRIVYGDRTLEILSADNEGGRNQYLICQCAQVTT